MKNSLLVVLFVLILVNLFSCTLSIEKRRYRPGYHVDIIHKHESKKSEIRQIELIKNNTYSGTVKVHAPSDNKHYRRVNVVQYTQPRRHVESNFVHLNNTNHSQPHYKFRPNSQLKKINSEKATKGLKGRKIAAWIIGAIGILFLVILGAMSGGAFVGLYPLLIGFCGGLLFAGIALLIRFAGLKKEIQNRQKYPEGPVPVSNSFKNGTFIFSIIITVLAGLAFMFAFFRYPFGLVSLIFACIAIVGAILTQIFGYRMLAVEKGFIPRLMIILSFLALVLSILAMIIIFIL